MEYHRKKFDDDLDVSSVFRMLTVRRWQRVVLLLVVLIVLFLLYKILSTPGKQPNSAIFCKNRLPEVREFASDIHQEY